jgi:hypothetical protein
LNTNSPGSAEPEEAKRPVPLRVLLGGLAAVLFAIFIGTQVFPVLYALLFPPLPPLPGNATQVSHTSADHGADEWVYKSDQSACTLVAFYAAQGGECQIAPECHPPSSDSASPAGTRVSTCVGQIKFSGFVMRWQAVITPQFDDKSELALSRSIFWSDTVPPLTATPTP